MKTEPTESLKYANKELSDIKIVYSGATKDSKIFKHKDLVCAFEQGQSFPKIKQLEWVEYENFHGRKSYFAKTPFSPYEVADGGDHFTMFSPDKRLKFKSADEAKAAAQTDFEQRVKECLE